MDGTEPGKSWLQRRNWWKIGFFVMLLAFEFARENAVLEGSTPPTIVGNATVTYNEPYISAQGRWTRLDKDEDLVPSSVYIECNEYSKECIQASVTVWDDAVGTPQVRRFPARFAGDSVSYQDETPACENGGAKLDHGSGDEVLLRAA